MTRDILIMLTIEIDCERMFNIANAFYDHCRSYNSIIFDVIMMIRCYNQKKNEMNEKLTIMKNLITKQLQKKNDNSREEASHNVSIEIYQ